MAKIIAYQVEVNGIQTVIRNQDDLTQAVKETTKAYKSSDFGTKEYKQSEKELAKLKNLQSKFRADVRDTARDQEIAADKGKGSYRALNAELVNLRRRYKELSAEERDLFGPDLLGRINKLDKELKDIDASMGNFQRNVGNYPDAFASLGGLDLAALAGGPGAVIAIGEAAISTAQYLKEVTDEFRQLRGEVQNLTDATGPELDDFTTRVASIAETFDATNQEILNAANSVSKQLEIPFTEALDRIEEGFVSGSNATGEFLDNLREYPTFFKEAELSADDLFRIINKQATEGIYTDKGVDSIKEATERLGELPKATRAALDLINVDSEKITQAITEDGIGGAIRIVSERLNDFSADSIEYRQAVANIFGSPGIDAGENFIKSLKDIGTETTSLIDATNEYQQQQLRTLQVNKDFAAIQNEIAKELGGTSAGLDNFSTILKTKALVFLLEFISQIKGLLSVFQPLSDAIFDLAEKFGYGGEQGDRFSDTIKTIGKGSELVLYPLRKFAEGMTYIVEGISKAVGWGRQFLEWMNIIEPKTKKGQEALDGMAGAWGFMNDEQEETIDLTGNTTKSIDDLNKKINNLSDSTNKAAVATDAFAKGSIAQLKNEVNKLKKELDNTAVGGEEGILSKLIDAEAALDKAEKFREELRNRLTTDRDFTPIQFISGIDAQVVEAQQAADAIVDINANKNEEILQQEVDLAAALQETRELIFGGINQALDNLTAASVMRQDQEIAALDRKYGREISLAEGNADKQEELENELQAEKEKVKKREFDNQKKYRRASILASLAEGIINILTAPTAIPIPFDSAARALRIGILTATSAQQISAINAQTVGAKGLIAEMARGGILRGAAHSDPSRGIPLTLNGKPIIAEHGEFVDYAEDGSIAVVNKRSTARFKPQLEQMSGKIFPGKRQMLSSINSYRGAGVKFAAQGAILQPEIQSVMSGRSGGSVGAGALYAGISEENAVLIGQIVGEYIKQGSKEGVAAGVNDETKRAQREARLNERTGLK